MSKNTITVNYTSATTIEYRQNEDNSGIINVYEDNKYIGMISTALLVNKMREDRNILI